MAASVWLQALPLCTVLAFFVISLEASRVNMEGNMSLSDAIGATEHLTLR